MKLFAEGELIIDDLGSANVVIIKEDEYKQPWNSYTGGLLKYTGLPKGTRLKITLEIIDDDSSQ